MKICAQLWNVGRESTVGIVTCYGLGDPGTKSCRVKFSTHPDQTYSPPSLPHNGYWIIAKGKAARQWHQASTPSSGEVKGVQLSLYSISVPSWQVTGWSLHLNCYQTYIMAVRHGPMLQLSQNNLHSSVTFTKATKIQWCMQVSWMYTQLNCSYLCDGHAGM